jgi:photosystem II oxygen-evolving enhancer protein 2
VCRRQLLELGGVAGVTALLPRAAEAKAPKGFQGVRDTADGYEFVYPFGWQEVNVNGVEAVFKDIIEPLESVSIQLVPTEKKSITEYGTPNEIAGTLASSVLTSSSDDVQLLKSEPEQDGGRYGSLAVHACQHRHIEVDVNSCSIL